MALLSRSVIRGVKSTRGLNTGEKRYDRRLMATRTENTKCAVMAGRRPAREANRVDLRNALSGPGDMGRLKLGLNDNIDNVTITERGYYGDYTERVRVIREYLQSSI